MARESEAVMGKRKGKVSAIRLDDAGAVDDVAISADMFRLERMDDDSWWACAYRGKERTAFSIYRKGKEVVVSVIEDSIGCKCKEFEPRNLAAQPIAAPADETMTELIAEMKSYCDRHNLMEDDFLYAVGLMRRAFLAARERGQ